MMQRLARSIVRRYPVPWRERYEEEVLALIDDSPVRLHDLGELVRGLFVERARALIEDSERPSRTAAILRSLKPMFIITFVGSAAGVGFILRQWRGQLSPLIGEVGMFGLVAFGLIAMLAQIVSQQRRSANHQPIPFWATLSVMPLAFVGFVLYTWAGWPGSGSGQFPVSGWVRMLTWGLIYANATGHMTSSFWTGAKMLDGIEKLAAADRQIKSALVWIDGCETMIAKGVPSPLDQAQAQLAEGERNREQALEQLQRLGYRARFQL
jgi:hypothetical protein